MDSSLNIWNVCLAIISHKILSVKVLGVLKRRYDTQHYDNQHNNKTLNTQYGGTWHSKLLCWVSLWWVSFMLSVTNKPIMVKVGVLSVIMPNVSMLYVVAPFKTT